MNNFYLKVGFIARRKAGRLCSCNFIIDDAATSSLSVKLFNLAYIVCVWYYTADIKVSELASVTK